MFKSSGVNKRSNGSGKHKPQLQPAAKQRVRRLPQRKMAHRMFFGCFFVGSPFFWRGRFFDWLPQTSPKKRFINYAGLIAPSALQFIVSFLQCYYTSIHQLFLPVYYYLYLKPSLQFPAPNLPPLLPPPKPILLPYQSEPNQFFVNNLWFHIMETSLLCLSIISSSSFYLFLALFIPSRHTFYKFPADNTHQTIPTFPSFWLNQKWHQTNNA